ncbi:hypothetical protein V5O48_015076 [Marasmius crinis-equi]|uniref:SH3b domain-containing protein n=1 Tax=Marasmius crinis-equi TaxID=585013 RepID=A0ABR3EVJ9_9AGAR
MKFTKLFLAALIPAIAMAQERTVYVGPADPEIRSLEKRAISGTVLVDGLRYRACPRTSCAAPGQYPKGTKISIVCYTRDDTTVVNGDPGWAKLTNGYWVALSFGQYVSWSSESGKSSSHRLQGLS